MNNSPEVSVVMSVYNGAQALPATLASVLDQQGCDFEFIVVNDGSTDGSGNILDAYAARDGRLRVIHQENTGLTRALVRGCAQARGEFIARQDCGDTSLPGRLERQSRFLREHDHAVLVACAAQFVAPAGEPLFVKSIPTMELNEGLSQLSLHQLQGPPHHGGTMFARWAYEKAGGYRPFFVVAQDIDLWLRLRELGDCVGEAEVGYQARLEPGSISARRRGSQVQLAAIALESARIRRQGGDDAAFLATQPAAAPARERNEKLARAQFLYFVGSCLRRTDPPAARRYFRESLRTHPLAIKSLIRLALA